ncbi:protein of unknown function (plasmid) [Cupriavidus taiwanensis]|uniref:Uncharacterized protein n=1 Tax=Cupriavidus taiwanensis TaxID=164546 RepID=A0A375I930_9BURK|nr:hypothetical protein CBM2588_B190062 [Cupriavidus taiwanensis]SOY94815.1 hypothetical protein CBM2591_B140061 [Cupriavidus taiwanensis]SOZ71728.1 hypothetical protein CBM2617_B180065 [Cupriavidus taiwanensis]SOZ86969.1 hypothetical protein CBM2618_B200065 [Cupriavidus taiwanensis]SOZ90027.1 hypothetical protein CBM2622_B190065 [Cupriavidus taiwanensis]
MAEFGKFVSVVTEFSVTEPNRPKDE